SSRSRHTRFSRDWSSDVCSSDLNGLVFCLAFFILSILDTFFPCSKLNRYGKESCIFFENGPDAIVIKEFICFLTDMKNNVGTSRSEERRVGIECKYAVSPVHAQR